MKKLFWFIFWVGIPLFSAGIIAQRFFQDSPKLTTPTEEPARVEFSSRTATGIAEVPMRVDKHAQRVMKILDTLQNTPNWSSLSYYRSDGTWNVTLNPSETVQVTGEGKSIEAAYVDAMKNLSTAKTASGTR